MKICIADYCKTKSICFKIEVQVYCDFIVYQAVILQKEGCIICRSHLFAVLGSLRLCLPLR